MSINNSNEVKLRFLGAAGTVTGSKHFLQTPEMNILVDCGLFQGIKPLRLMNWQALPVEINEINIILITHAHLDHVGYLPVLVKAGYKGRILMTAPTADLAEIILKDSAKLQEEDAERSNQGGYSKHKPALPLYNTKDAENTLNLIETHPAEEWIELSKSIKFRYRKNAHILGAAFIEMDCFGKRIVFSGDIGKKESLTLPAPEKPESADFLLIESTYGNRLHSTEDVGDELSLIINDTIWKKGNLLIPSFAVGRAQEIMVLINRLKEKIQIPDIPVYLDTPMGVSATNIYYKYMDWHKLSEKECEEIHANVKFIKTIDESWDVINDRRPKIVIAASGMITGGRVLNYLTHYLENKHNTILLVGYQAEGTRGRALHEKAHELKIYGKYYPVKAESKEIEGLSAHADQAGLLDWVSEIKTKPRVFIVHGEPNASDTLRVKFKDALGWDAEVPKLDTEVILFKTDAN